MKKYRIKISAWASGYFVIKDHKDQLITFRRFNSIEAAMIYLGWHIAFNTPAVTTNLTIREMIATGQLPHYKQLQAL